MPLNRAGRASEACLVLSVDRWGWAFRDCSLGVNGDVTVSCRCSAGGQGETVGGDDRHGENGQQSRA